MNKREREKTLKYIIKLVNSFILSIDKYKGTIDLASYSKEVMQDILIDRFETSDELMEISIRMDSFRQEIAQHISEMKDGADKDEWDEFYYNIIRIEDMIYISDNNIYTIDEYIDAMIKFKNALEQLL